MKISEYSDPHNHGNHPSNTTNNGHANHANPHQSIMPVISKPSQSGQASQTNETIQHNGHKMHHGMHNMHDIPVTGDFLSLSLALFIVGFSGGFAHCAFMCGPFVTSQVGNRLQAIGNTKMSEFARLKGAALIPYHLGRLTTYTILGGIVATVAQGTEHLWANLTNVLLFVAGLLMVFSALPTVLNKIFQFKTPLLNNIATGKLGRKCSAIITPLMASPIGFKGYLLGIILGFLPCGMVYAALGVAASTAVYWQGMAVMAAFALGTIPALVVVGILGNLMFGKLKKYVTILAKVVTILAGIWLCVIAITSL